MRPVFPKIESLFYTLAAHFFRTFFPAKIINLIKFSFFPLVLINLQIILAFLPESIELFTWRGKMGIYYWVIYVFFQFTSNTFYILFLILFGKSVNAPILSQCDFNSVFLYDHLKNFSKISFITPVFRLPIANANSCFHKTLVKLLRS